jgi:hypothetical protein
LTREVAAVQQLLRNSGAKLVQTENSLVVNCLKRFFFVAGNKLREEGMKQGKKIPVSSSSSNDLYSGV